MLRLNKFNQSAKNQVKTARKRVRHVQNELQCYGCNWLAEKMVELSVFKRYAIILAQRLSIAAGNRQYSAAIKQ